MTSWAVQPQHGVTNSSKCRVWIHSTASRHALDWATDQMEAMTIWKVGTEAEFKWMEVNA